MADTAETVLERAVAAVQAGTLDYRSLMWTFAASSLLLASAVEPPGGGLEVVNPLVVQRDGRDILAVFTTPDRAERFAPAFRYLTARLGLELLGGVPSDVGLVVNPGSEIGFEMEPDGIVRLLAELRSGVQPETRGA